MKSHDSRLFNESTRVQKAMLILFLSIVFLSITADVTYAQPAYTISQMPRVPGTPEQPIHRLLSTIPPTAGGFVGTHAATSHSSDGSSVNWGRPSGAGVDVSYGPDGYGNMPQASHAYHVSDTRDTFGVRNLYHNLLSEARINQRYGTYYYEPWARNRMMYVIETRVPLYIKITGRVTVQGASADGGRAWVTITRLLGRANPTEVLPHLFNQDINTRAQRVLNSWVVLPANGIYRVWIGTSAWHALAQRLPGTNAAGVDGIMKLYTPADIAAVALLRLAGRPPFAAILSDPKILDALDAGALEALFDQEVSSQLCTEGEVAFCSADDDLWLDSFCLKHPDLTLCMERGLNKMPKEPGEE